jgi:hypothetical protein
MRRIKPIIHKVKMTEQKRQQECGKAVEEMLKVSQKLHEQRGKLVSIVLEETDAKTKLGKLRRELLLYRVPEKEKSENCASQSQELGEMFARMNLEQLAMTSGIIKTTLEPVTEHVKLLDDIANTIRSIEMCDEQKIEMISNMLM